jgi:hypothetical protein
LSLVATREASEFFTEDIAVGKLLIVAVRIGLLFGGLWLLVAVVKWTWLQFAREHA